MPCRSANAILEHTPNTAHCTKVLMLMRICFVLLQTCELAVELLHHPKLGKYIAGIDFSGNPNKNTFSDYIPALAQATASGLKVMRLKVMLMFIILKQSSWRAVYCHITL
jgi:hypothetical protein